MAAAAAAALHDCSEACPCLSSCAERNLAKRKLATLCLLHHLSAFLVQIGNDNFYEVLQKIRGPSAVEEWRRLQDVMRPLASAATMLPPVAFRCAARPLAR